MSDRKIDDQAKNIVQGGDEWSCSECWIDLEFIQSHWNPCTEEACENDHTEKRYACCKAQMVVDLKQKAHSKNNGRTNRTVQKSYSQFLRKFLR